MRFGFGGAFCLHIGWVNFVSLRSIFDYLLRFWVVPVFHFLSPRFDFDLLGTFGGATLSLPGSTLLLSSLFGG